MRVGDLVRISPLGGAQDREWSAQFQGRNGIIVRDYSPLRPPEVGRVVDVLWDSGTLEDMYSDELELVNETG